MTAISRTEHILSSIAACCVCWVAFGSGAHAQNAPLKTSSKNSAPALTQQMVGTWNVQQRMWPGYGAEAVSLPPAIARRRLVEGSFLEEVMQPAKKRGQATFTRIAYFEYNAVNQQCEYFSLDSRAPQMMNERSDKAEEQSKPDQGGIKLSGGSFVAPKWGESTNVAFTYRFTVGQIEKNNQIVRLYLTPQSREMAKEFMAFEYRLKDSARSGAC